MWICHTLSQFNFRFGIDCYLEPMPNILLLSQLLLGLAYFCINMSKCVPMTYSA